MVPLTTTNQSAARFDPTTGLPGCSPRPPPRLRRAAVAAGQAAEKRLQAVILSEAKNLALSVFKTMRDPSSPTAPQDDSLKGLFRSLWSRCSRFCRKPARARDPFDAGTVRGQFFEVSEVGFHGPSERANCITEGNHTLPVRDWSYSSWCAHSSGAGFHSLAMVPRERALRHERGVTNAPLRVDDGQFALGFESANLRKNRRPPARAGRRSALRLLFQTHHSLCAMLS
jgi:hypothetical protein